MSPVKIIGMPCMDPHEISCKRPARELGQFCTACWLGMTPSQRAFEKEIQATDPLETLFRYHLPAHIKIHGDGKPWPEA